MDEKTIRENQSFNKAVLLRVRQKCLERNTSITKIEEALGYGNGSISTGWVKAKKKAPMERIEAVAKVLGCSADDLMPKDYADTKKEPAPTTEDGSADFNIKYLKLSPELRKQLDNYADFLLTQQDEQ